MCFRRMICCLQRHGTEGLKKENSKASGELGAWCVRGLSGRSGEAAEFVGDQQEEESIGNGEPLRLPE